MGHTPSFVQAEENYSMDREHLFRRELETFLLVAVAVSDAIASGTNVQSSLSSKRGSYLLPVGKTSIT